MSRYFAARGWILAALFIVLIIDRAFSGAPLRPVWLWLVVAGIGLRAWAGAHLGDHGNAARPEAKRLSRTGPYRFSRNPLYVSNIIVAWGLILYANASSTGALSVGFSVDLALLIVLHHVVLIKHEERALREIHGPEYARYLAEVPRWIGRPGKSEGGVGIPPRENPAAVLKEILARQGRNVIYALACAGILWIAAR